MEHWLRINRGLQELLKSKLHDVDVPGGGIATTKSLHRHSTEAESCDEGPSSRPPHGMAHWEGASIKHPTR